MVQPILLYASPVWGINYLEELDTVQQHFLKRLFKLPRHTPMYFVRLENNRIHTQLQVIKYTLNYWLHIMSKKDGTLLRDSYEALRRYSTFGSPSSKYNWTLKLQEILSEVNMSHVWESQSREIVKENINVILDKYKEKLIQSDINKTNSSSSLPHYKNIMDTNPHTYLNINLPLQVTSIIMQIRLNFDRITINNKSITFNAWFNQNNSSCTNCNSNSIEDINHFLFNCSFYDNIRKKYNIQEENFVNIDFYRGLTTTQGFTIYNYINECFKLRYIEPHT